MDKKFDGDQLSGKLALDAKVSEGFEYLAPHQSAMDIAAPGRVTENNKWPTPVIMTVHNWYHSNKEIDAVKFEKMKAFMVQ